MVVHTMRTKRSDRPRDWRAVVEGSSGKQSGKGGGSFLTSGYSEGARREEAEHVSEWREERGGRGTGGGCSERRAAVGRRLRIPSMQTCNVRQFFRRESLVLGRGGSEVLGRGGVGGDRSKCEIEPRSECARLAPIQSGTPPCACSFYSDIVTSVRWVLLLCIVTTRTFTCFSHS